METEQERLAPINELAQVIPGYSPRPMERKPRGRYLLLAGRNLNQGRLVQTGTDAYADDRPIPSFQNAVARSGDIIVSTLFDRRKLYIYGEGDPPAVVTNSCAIVRAGKAGDYIVSYLRTEKGQAQFLSDASQATSGSVIRRLTTAALSKIRVPLLPFAELARLGDAHIEASNTDDLIDLRADLHAKDSEIARLKDDLDSATRR